MVSEIVLSEHDTKTVLETVLRSPIASVVLEQWWDKNVTSHHHSERTNLRKSWIEIPKSNPIILRILSGNKGVKTVLETVLRLCIESTVLEEIALQVVTRSVKNLINFASKSISKSVSVVQPILEARSVTQPTLDQP